MRFNSAFKGLRKVEILETEIWSTRSHSAAKCFGGDNGPDV